jgi:hypothetical protein
MLMTSRREVEMTWLMLNAGPTEKAQIQPQARKLIEPEDGATTNCACNGTPLPAKCT